MLFNFIQTSSNSKTGPIPTVYISKDTCPDVCPLKNNGCYAGLGLTNIFWKRLNDGVGIKFPQLLRNISKLWPKTLWRYAIAGDLPGKNNVINSKALAAMVAANKGRNGFAYTHKPVLFEQARRDTVMSNRKAIRQANKNGFTINLSANNLEHADKLKALKLGPVVTILPVDVKERSLLTPQGHPVTVCPATYLDGMTCARCKICSKQRETIVGFPAHGSGKRIVTETFLRFSSLETKKSLAR